MRFSGGNGTLRWAQTRCVRAPGRRLPGVLTRDEHLQWAKDRALAYVRLDDCDQALASFVSDLRKHPETVGVLDHTELLGLFSLVLGDELLSRPGLLRMWIEEFN